MNKIENDRDKIYNYFIFLKIYEKNAKAIQDNKDCFIEIEGSLINLKDYEYNKKIICFDELMKLTEKSEFEQKLNELASLDISSKIKELNPVFLNTTEDLIKFIKEKNEYILIDPNFFNISSNIQEQEKFKVNVMNNILELKIGKDSLKFYNNKYILNEASYYACNDELKLSNISKAMLELYIFDQNIKKNQKKDKVYLVSKNDIDEWKESTNYENIKNNLFKDNDNLEFIEYGINYQLFKFYKDYKKNIKHINLNSYTIDYDNAVKCLHNELFSIKLMNDY